MKTRLVKGKVWGPFEELDAIKRHLESFYNCTLSQIKASDQGGGHFFFTIFLEAASIINNDSTNGNISLPEGIIVGRNTRRIRGEREWPNSHLKK